MQHHNGRGFRGCVLAIVVATIGTWGLGGAVAQAQRAPRAAAAPTVTWTDPNPGVRHMTKVIPSIPAVVHAVVVDLRVPGVRIRTTPYAQRWSTVTEYARRNHLAAAINGGFWGFMQRPIGLAAGNGQLWPTSRGDDDEHSFFAVDATGRAWISVPSANEEEVDARRAAEAVSGRPVLVQDGQVSPEATAEPQYNSRHPRTAVGISRDGHTVYLVVVDGRQGHSRGMRMPELARLLVDDLHVHAAINLDGGGSAAMFVAQEGGIVSVPSGGRWDSRVGLQRAQKRPSQVRTRDDGTTEYFIRGVEREVMNHIGVIAPAGARPAPTSAPTANPANPASPGGAADPSAPAPGTAAPVVEGDDTYYVEQPEEYELNMGQAREIVYPALFGGGALLFLIVVGVGTWLVVRRVRSKKKAAVARAAARDAAPVVRPVPAGES
ncbi:MAG: phosphodiester glycosidase family protein [Deltaproteobacteria bacterium]|nr:phosphodiester glycosidase family protein [Deltaproteobacteria bacterium]